MTNLGFWLLRQDWTSGLHPEADIALVLLKRPACDPNPTFKVATKIINGMC